MESRSIRSVSQAAGELVGVFRVGLKLAVPRPTGLELTPSGGLLLTLRDARISPLALSMLPVMGLPVRMCRGLFSISLSRCLYGEDCRISRSLSSHQLLPCIHPSLLSLILASSSLLFRFCEIPLTSLSPPPFLPTLFSNLAGKNIQKGLFNVSQCCFFAKL